MNPIELIQSRTVVMPGNDIDTDQIIPARFLTTTSREGLGQFAFNDLRRDVDGNDIADFILNRPEAAGCSILVAGNNFGCGSSREHAPWALLDYGLRAVISTEIADIFTNNSLKNGFIPVVVDPGTHQNLLANPGIEVTIDVAARSITLEGGVTVSFPLDNFARLCLLEGIDQLDFIHQQTLAITRFEENRQWMP